MSEKRWALKPVHSTSAGSLVHLESLRGDFEEIEVPGPGEMIAPVGQMSALLDWMDLHVGHRYPLDQDSYIDDIRKDFRALLPPEEPPEPELLPCPFCGADDVVVAVVELEGGEWWTRCNCGVTGPELATKQLAIDAWNRRAGGGR